MSKEQSIWNLHGKGAMMMKAQIYSNEEHGIGDHLRYLGPQLEENGRCQVEVTLRIIETQTTFDYYKAFWSKSTKLEVKRMIFRSMILSTLMSGMICLNTTQADVSRLHLKMMALARKALAGRATIKDINGHHMIKKTEATILKMMKIGTMHVELDIARLKFWQRIFRAPNHHQQLITAVFGGFDFDDDFESFRQHSRYFAFQESL